MTAEQFVTWMKGFVTACNEYSPTPKQWDDIKDTLAIVEGPIDRRIFDYKTPEGFGYYSSNSSMPYPEKKKQEQLND